MKLKSKPRNYIALALFKRSGSASGAHIKSNKAKRKQVNQQLKQEIQRLAD
jgi:hypothetical protein